MFRLSVPEWMNHKGLLDRLRILEPKFVSVIASARLQMVKSTLCTHLVGKVKDPEVTDISKVWRTDIFVKPEGNATISLYGPAGEEETLVLNVIAHHWDLLREKGSKRELVESGTL